MLRSPNPLLSLLMIAAAAPRQLTPKPALLSLGLLGGWPHRPPPPTRTRRRRRRGTGRHYSRRDRVLAGGGARAEVAVRVGLAHRRLLKASLIWASAVGSHMMISTCQTAQPLVQLSRWPHGRVSPLPSHVGVDESNHTHIAGWTKAGPSSPSRIGEQNILPSYLPPRTSYHIGLS